jgi:hypothetical protein
MLSAEEATAQFQEAVTVLAQFAEAEPVGGIVSTEMVQAATEKTLAKWQQILGEHLNNVEAVAARHGTTLRATAEAVVRSILFSQRKNE